MAGESLGKENYDTYMAKAGDTQQSNSFRADNAQRALDSYKTIQLDINGFANSIGKLNSAELLLIENANAIKNHNYIEPAIKIAQYAREIQLDYESLRLKYVERFNLQTDLLQTLVNNKGNIYSPPVLTKLKNAGARVPIIASEVKSLIEKIDKTSQEMSDSYFSLKGKSGLADYPNKFIENK